LADRVASILILALESDHARVRVQAPVSVPIPVLRLNRVCVPTGPDRFRDPPHPIAVR